MWPYIILAAICLITGSTLGAFAVIVLQDSAERERSQKPFSRSESDS